MNKVFQYARLALIGFLNKTQVGQALVAAVDAGQKFIVDFRIYSRKSSGGGSTIQFFESSELAKKGQRNIGNQKLNAGERAAIVGIVLLAGNGPNAGQTPTDAQLATINFTPIDDNAVVANSELTININGKDHIAGFPVQALAHNGQGDLTRGAMLLDQPIYVTDADTIKAQLDAPIGATIPAETVVHFEFITAKVLN